MIERGAEKPKIDSALWSMGGTASARLQSVQAEMPWWAKPMNCQAVRLELVRRLFADCRIARVVETGTFLGTTTEFFAQFGLPVVTAEHNPDVAARASERLRKFGNVDLRICDSVLMLQSLVQEPIDRNVPTLFYLDAHWEKHLPLRQEAELAIGNFSKAVLLIDDFAVPDDPGYTFDDYGSGNRLDLAYLMAAKLPAIMTYFPSTPSHQETGARRGCVVVTADPAMAMILDGVALLRRWNR